MWFLESFWGEPQRRDMETANRDATKSLDRGYSQYNKRADEAYNLFTPYAEQGQQANAMYSQAIGMGTDQERVDAQARYFSDPAFQQITSNQQNAMLRNLNARGISGSGAAVEAGSRIAYDNYGGWLDRLNNQVGQGFQATGAQATIRQGQGQMAYDHGLTSAANRINYGNALAQSRSTGINNLLAMGEVAAKAAGAG